MDRSIRIVVGEGRTAQRGLLRFVLEGEGFEVVAETNSSADLPEVIRSQSPDVVVLDDGIGVMAVSMVHDVAPAAKVVLVWPADVVPIGGDARVEPAKILKDLGPAVEHVAIAAGIGLGAGLTRPDWIDKVKKDPATLRSKLAKGGAVTAIGGAAAKRRSVTRLQRRSRRLHPSTQEPAADTTRRDEDAAVVVLPFVAAGAAGAAGSADEPILDITGADVPVDATAEEVDEPSEWNRRLGTLAMSGAAAVSALVLALALGGGRIDVSVVRGDGVLPPGVPGFLQPGAVTDGDGPFGPGGLGGSGYDPTAAARDYHARGQAAGDRGVGPVASPRDLGPSVSLPDVPDGSGGGVDGGGGDNGGGGGGTGGGGGNGGGGNGAGHGNGGGSSGGGVNGTEKDCNEMHNGKKPKGGKHGCPPGHSGEHNPHGGPPGQTGQTPAHGPGLGVGNGTGNGNGERSVHPPKG
jgi:hypothetical protein